VGVRDLAWLTASLGLVIAPHALRAPLWLTVLTLCLYGWRVYFTMNRGPLPSRLLILGVALVGMLGVWLEYRTLFGRTPGIMMLVLFSGLKLLETRNQRDAAIAVFLGYFLIVTNFLYTQSIPSALLMCAGVFMLTSALVGFSAAQRPLRANLRTATVLLLHAAPAALALFVLFPRVQGPLWGLPQDAYTGISGLSDHMTPGNLSRLVLSDATAFRAEFRGETPAHRQLYWRGPVLWDFDGRTWSQGVAALGELRQSEGGRGRFEYTVVLEPHNHHWMFALKTAAALPQGARYTVDGQVVTQMPVRSRMRYEMTSIAEPAARPDEHPQLLRRALRLPPGYNPRSSALAADWRQGAALDAQVLERALAFLRAGRFQYTLEPPLLARDSVDDFLFNTKSGFCEHFASAFVFLMRSAGVPARVVVGYQGGYQNPIDRIVTVRQSDAHAWAEVFLEGRGWVRIDPTAASAPVRLESGLARSVPDAAALPFLLRTDSEWALALRYRWDALAHKWNVWVLGYNPERQRELLAHVGLPEGDWRALTAALFTLLGVITVGLLAWSFRRFVRPDPVQAAWRAFCAKLAERGLKRGAHEGPRDYSERAARALPMSRLAILQIGALYIALRYGAEASGAGIAELKRLVRELQLA
jgi:transglutaminase-like putative cysteine protease